MEAQTKKNMERNKFKSNHLVTVYTDWQNQKDVIGTALLIKKLKKGLPFILKDTVVVKVPEKVQGLEIFEWTEEEKGLGICKVYNSERWLCKMIKSEKEQYPINQEFRFDIRYLEGNFADAEIQSEYKELTEDDVEEEQQYISEWKTKNLMDEFLLVNGEQIY